MEEVKKADFTMDQMLADGWTKTNDPAFLLEKKIPNTNPLNASEDSDIKFVVHGLYNEWRFGIIFPDGGILNFAANTWDELNTFQRMICFYDPPF